MSEENEQKDSGETVDEDVLSLDGLDDIEEEDSEPVAESEKEAPKTESEADSSAEAADPGTDVVNEEEGTPKKSLAERFPKAAQILNKIKKPFTVIWRPFGRICSVISSKFGRVFEKVLVRAKKIVIFLKTEFPEKLKFFKTRLSSFVSKIFLTIKSVKDLNRKQQVTIASIFALILVFMFLTKQLVTQHLWIPTVIKSDLKSLAKVSNKSMKFDETKDLVFLHSAFSQPYFTFLLEGIVVNLKRSMRSTKLPMARVELYLKLDSTETAVEVKHRQLEIKDFVSRILEEVSYDDLLSNYGKKRLKLSIKTKVNDILNKGRVHDVYFKEIIHKR